MFVKSNIQISFLNSRYSFWSKLIPPISFLIIHDPARIRMDLINSLQYPYPPSNNSHTYNFELLLPDLIRESGLTQTATDPDAFLWPIPLGIYGPSNNLFYYDYFLPLLQKQSINYKINHGVDHFLLHHASGDVSIFRGNAIFEQPEVLTRTDIEGHLKITDPRRAWHTIITHPYSNSSFNLQNLPRNYSLCFVASTRIYMYWGNVIRPLIYDYLKQTDHPCYYLHVLDRLVDGDGLGKLATGLMNRIDNIYQSCETVIVPHGDFPCSKRFYDALRAGAVPIVLSDPLVVPYEFLYYDLSQLVVMLPELEPQKIGRARNLMHSHVIRKFSNHARQLDRFFYFPADMHMTPGDSTWAWCWHAFILMTICKMPLRSTHSQNLQLS